MQRVLFERHRKKTKLQTDNLLKGLAYCYSHFNENLPQFAPYLDALARLQNLLNVTPSHPDTAYHPLVDSIIAYHNKHKQAGLPQLIASSTLKAAFAMMLARFSDCIPATVLSPEMLDRFDALLKKWVEQKTSNYLLDKIVTPQHTPSSLFTSKVNFSEIALVHTAEFKEQTLQIEIFCWALATFFENALNANRLRDYQQQRAQALRELRANQVLLFNRLPSELMEIVAKTVSAQEHRLGHVVK